MQRLFYLTYHRFLLAAFKPELSKLFDNHSLAVLQVFFALVYKNKIVHIPYIVLDFELFFDDMIKVIKDCQFYKLRDLRTKSETDLRIVALGEAVDDPRYLSGCSFVVYELVHRLDSDLVRRGSKIVFNVAFEYVSGRTVLAVESLQVSF